MSALRIASFFASVKETSFGKQAILEGALRKTPPEFGHDVSYRARFWSSNTTRWFIASAMLRGSHIEVHSLIITEFYSYLGKKASKP
jgi:hypothetical protein